MYISEFLLIFLKAYYLFLRPPLFTLFHVRMAVCLPAIVLRHYATSRKVAGSIPDETIGFFN
jgi:hypothetical protein